MLLSETLDKPLYGCLCSALYLYAVYNALTSKLWLRACLLSSWVLFLNCVQAALYNALHVMNTVDVF